MSSSAVATGGAPGQMHGRWPRLYTTGPENPAAARQSMRPAQNNAYDATGVAARSGAPSRPRRRTSKEHRLGARDLSVSIVIPVLNEAAGVEARLRALAPLRQRGAEVIVVDGASADATAAIALRHCNQVLIAPRGRASQMNAGAAAARGDILVFLHADTRLPGGALGEIAQRLETTGRVWGRFDVIIEGKSRLLPLIAAMMNLRSRLTGVATGDQAMFVRKAAFDQVGGFPDIALMEDIALSRALKRLSPPVCLRAKVRTAGRRWDERGVLRTILLMWGLRLAYFLGADPAALAVRYGYRAEPRDGRAP